MYASPSTRPLTLGVYRKLTLVKSPSNSSAAERSSRIDLLRGHPSTCLLPAEDIYHAASVALHSPYLLPEDSYAESRHPLHYGPDNGNLNVREEIGRWCAERYRLGAPVSHVVPVGFEYVGTQYMTYL